MNRKIIYYKCGKCHGRVGVDIKHTAFNMSDLNQFPGIEGMFPRVFYCNICTKNIPMTVCGWRTVKD